MTEHITQWLEAYYDGELQARQSRQVETHLAQCAGCRTELVKLQALGNLLQESPSASEIIPPQRFVAMVGLRLPRRPLQPAWQRTLETGWRLAPLGLLGVWAFIQAVFIVAGILMTALRLGLGGDMIAGVLPPSQAESFLTSAFSLSNPGLGEIGQTALRALINGGPLGWGFMLYIALLLINGLLFWSWLASWRIRQRGIT